MQQLKRVALNGHQNEWHENDWHQNQWHKQYDWRQYSKVDASTSADEHHVHDAHDRTTHNHIHDRKCIAKKEQEGEEGKDLEVALDEAEAPEAQDEAAVAGLADALPDPRPDALTHALSDALPDALPDAHFDKAAPSTDQAASLYKTVGVDLCLSRQVTNQSLGYACVNYHSVQDAERALHTLNYSYIKGRSCRIMSTQRDPSMRRNTTGNISVKNLDPDMDDKSLHATFGLFGKLLPCKA
ncbi:unnamed protein product, partial [Prorocentrum cordatum]